MVHRLCARFCVCAVYHDFDGDGSFEEVTKSTLPCTYRIVLNIAQCAHKPIAERIGRNGGGGGGGVIRCNWVG